MRLLAIDPGNEESALLIYDTDTREPVHWIKAENAWHRAALGVLPQLKADALAIEMVASYGMPVGASVFETCVEAGRFIELWENLHKGHLALRVYRREVKLHLCNSARAKDANVRQALLDRYGGKDAAVGRKASPGPLHGITGDVWSALAIAVTVAERAPVAETLLAI